MKSKLGFVKNVAFLLGPLVFFASKYWLIASGFDSKMAVVMATLLWMLFWWLRSALSPAIPALLPFVVFPIYEVVPPVELASSLGSTTILLFLGGFVLSSAIERWGLHVDFVAFLLKRKNLGLKNLLFIFIFVSAFASMWISNTAAILILIPIIEILFRPKGSKLESGDKRILGLFLLAAAYASSVGGLATLIGSPPNAIAANYLRETGQADLSFAYWLKLALPFAIFSVFVLYGFFSFILRKDFKEVALGSALQKRLDDFIGQSQTTFRIEKLLTFLVLLACVLAWLFLPLLSEWTSLKLNDASVALAAALMLCVLPTFSKGANQKTLVSVEQVEALPWSTLFLFAGGLALSKGLQATGWVDWLREHLQAFAGVPSFLLLFSIVSSGVLLTELMSNTALAAILVPWATSFESILSYPVVDLVMALCFAASLSFMLPVATPPNALVFSRNHVSLKTMLKLGFALNFIFVVCISLYVAWVLPLLR